MSSWANLEESRAYEQQIREIGEQLADLQRARDQELGGKLKEVEAEAKEKDKETLKIDADIKVANWLTYCQHLFMDESTIHVINSIIARVV